MPIPRILFDGRVLLADPLGDSALHLLDLLAHFPDSVEAHIALPGTPPEWLTGNFEVQVQQTADQLLWEQQALPTLGRALGADLHLTTASAPLFTRLRTWVSPADHEQIGGGFRDRLRKSLGRGGAARAGIAWPLDVPLAADHSSENLLSPAVHPRFIPKNRFLPPEIKGFPDIPATYILVHAPQDQETLRLALEAWTWATGPIGELYPLLFLGLAERAQAFVCRLAADLNIRDSFLFFPAPNPTELHLLYQTASAVFYPAPVGPWSSPLRLGIACGIPVVAIETAASSAIAGAAAYLSPADDPRSLSAALISVIVRDDIRKQLTDAARLKRNEWSGEKLKAGLAEMYNRST